MADGVWHQVMLDDGLGIAAKVVERDGRWVVTDLYLHGERITASDLRRVQPARFEARANVHGGALERVSLEHIRTHGQDEPTLAEMRLAFQAALAGIARIRNDRPHDTSAKRDRLTRPDGSDPDAFYRAVAEAYREYLTTTKAPATAIAEEADVPVGTVYRWVREARRRGHLPPGERGRAS